MGTSRSTPSEAKPGYLWTYRSASSPSAAPRACHRPPDCTRKSPHSSAHPGTLWWWLTRRLRRFRWQDVVLTWNHTKYHNGSRKHCFHHPGHVPVIRGNPAMVLAVITWIGKKHVLYSGVSSISLVEHCVSWDMIEGFYRSWDLYITCQLVDSLQQKKKTVFIKRKWNHVIFSRATVLSFHPVYI